MRAWLLGALALAGCVEGERPNCLSDVDCPQAEACVAGACALKGADASADADVDGLDADVDDLRTLKCPWIDEAICAAPYKDALCIYELKPGHFYRGDCDDLCDIVGWSCHGILSWDAMQECSSKDIKELTDEYCLDELTSSGVRCVCAMPIAQ
ncbi:hypothetical protein KKF91_05670 [Myxococcota bacterium]|nr:hypothetical protein [Myxococcota bacterium]MBU1430038.1 hypothetical protein [Myxococcota bacterium]MBU1899173.1 hypothetical protein [Myxococcota bacterium]